MSKATELLCNARIRQIRQAVVLEGAPAKSSSSVSSRISDGFKKETGGQNYKDYFTDEMRSKIARLGANYGVETYLLVGFAVAARDLDAAAKNKMIDEMLPQ